MRIDGNDGNLAGGAPTERRSGSGPAQDRGDGPMKADRYASHVVGVEIAPSGRSDPR
jgi:hypothetical protein